jgi:hypothetical protein
MLTVFAERALEDPVGVAGVPLAQQGRGGGQLAPRRVEHLPLLGVGIEEGRFGARAGDDEDEEDGERQPAKEAEGAGARATDHGPGDPGCDRPQGNERERRGLREQLLEVVAAQVARVAWGAERGLGLAHCREPSPCKWACDGDSCRRTCCKVGESGVGCPRVEAQGPGW